MGDVLFDATVWRKWLHREILNLGFTFTYEKLFEQWDAMLVDVCLGRKDYGLALNDFFRNIGLTVPQIRELNRRSLRMKEEAEKKRVLFPGVSETLAVLKKGGISCALLSDTESTESKIRSMLDKLHINRFFSVVVCSIDIGHVKPSPQSYRLTLDRMGVSANKALFVGHDDDELKGAQEIGITPMAFNYAGTLFSKNAIASFDEIPEIVFGRSRKKPGWRWDAKAMEYSRIIERTIAKKSG